MDRRRVDTVADNSKTTTFLGKRSSGDKKKQQSIRTTTAAIIGVTLLGLFLLLYVFSCLSLDSGFSSLEERITGDNVKRAVNAVNSEVDRLDSITNAWATSEELSGFINSGDTSAARLIFTDGRLVDVGINILLITDSNGSILWHKYMNLDYNHQMPTPKSLLSQITGREDLIGDKGIKGTMMLNSGPMLVASRPLYNQETGVFIGNILVGRYLDRREISSLSNTTQLNLAVIDNREEYEEYFSLFDGGNAGKIVLQALNNEYIAGFSEIYDIYGEPVAILQITEPRDVTMYGRGVFDMQILMLIFACLIFGVVTLALIQRSVISRLEKLNRQIGSVADSENTGKRIVTDGNDEISSVGTAINMMLESIDKGKEQYARLFDNANDMIFTLDPAGNFVSANKETEKRAGTGKEGVIGRNIQEFVRAGDLKKIDEILAGKKSGDRKIETGFISGMGEERIIELSAQPLMNTDGLTGTFVIARDVTVKRKADEEIRNHRNRLKELVKERTTQLEEANTELEQTNTNLVREVEERIKFEESLAAEKERLSVTLSSIADGVVATNFLGIITIINKEATLKTGFSREMAEGMRIDRILQLEKDGKKEDVLNIVEKVISCNEVIEINTGMDLLGRKGEICPVVLSAAPLLDKSGNAIGAVIVFRDISERLGWEEEVLRRQKLESLGVLAGGIAHDFNNILTAISGNIALAKNSVEGNEKFCSRLNEAEKAISRAKDITRQLITFSKGGSPVKRVTDIRDIVRESAEFVSHGSNIRLDFDIAYDLMNVDVDRGQISQVIENLVINGIQAMPDGGIIRVCANNVGMITGKDGLEDGEYIVIKVKDEGSGIPEESRKKIFDPYYTTKKNGNGLGLASCMSIIRKHGGAIKLVSEVDIGTEFSIYLPATMEAVGPDACMHKGDLRGSSRVLVMDDDRDIYEVIPDLLREYGFEVEIARDGAEALRVYQESVLMKRSVDVFVMDLTIPGGLGGVDTVALLREYDPGILAIVSSGYSNDPVMANYREHGFDAVLPKPYEIQELVSLINRLVSEKKDLNSGD
ncbi:MAG: PAS domain S-box protein [Methanomicrobiaceae archaeon]|nr:PAS domain S-box protein [Methanomicrobiaceae archaeon]